MGKKLTLTLVALCSMLGLAAQGMLGNLPATVDVNDVTILKQNVLVISSHDSIVVNASANRIDTLSIFDEAKIITPEEAEREFATQPARAPRSAARSRSSTAAARPRAPARFRVACEG